MLSRRKILYCGVIVFLFFAAYLTSPAVAQSDFKFGTWQIGSFGDSTHFHALLDTIADTLRMHYLRAGIENETIKNLYESKGIRCAVLNKSVPDTICYPYYYSCTHYKIWEAEGGQIYFGSDSLKHVIGRKVQDGDVGAWMVSPGSGDPAGTIQTGPYYAHRLKFIGLYGEEDHTLIDYHIAFRVRAGVDTTAGDQNVAIVSLTKTHGYDLYTVVCDTLKDSDFADTNYFEDTLTYNTQWWYEHGPNDTTMFANERSYAVWGIEYRVFWFGNRDFYIDKVTVFDLEGSQLMAGNHDSRIIDYVNSHYESSPAVDAWYLREEMHPHDAIHSYLPWRHVDSVLSSVNSQKRGFAATSGPTFINIVMPREVHFHAYPLKGAYDGNPPIAHATDSPGGDSVSLQNAWDALTEDLFVNKTESQEAGIGLSSTLQSFSQYECTSSVRDNCPNNPDQWAWYWRMPSTQELRCEANLALAYGSVGVMYWKYRDGKYISSGIHWRTIIGLLDSDNLPTANWYCVRDVIGPFMEEMGQTFYDLNWQGAGLCHSVSQITNSFIDSVKSNEYAPDNVYAEVGFEMFLI